MKLIGEPSPVTASNAWGRPQTCLHSIYEVEAEDAGKVRDNYLGYRRRSLMLTRADIGRQIDVMTDGSGWTCWSFLTN